jgi:hypothetical protein
VHKTFASHTSFSYRIRTSVDGEDEDMLVSRISLGPYSCLISLKLLTMRTDSLKIEGRTSGKKKRSILIRQGNGVVYPEDPLECAGHGRLVSFFDCIAERKTKTLQISLIS